MLKRLCVFGALLGAVVLLLGAVACSDSSTSPTPTHAAITITLTPTAVTSTVCAPACQSTDGRLFQWRVVGALTVQETAGVGGTVTSITETSFNPPITFTAADVIQGSGTNHVAARGMLALPINIVYGLVNNPSASRSHVFVFVVQFTDDRGNQLAGNAQWVAN